MILLPSCNKRAQKADLCFNIDYNVKTETAVTLELKVRKLGNFLGVVLPKKAAAVLNVEEGDRLYITQAPGGYRLTAADPEFGKQMEVARKGMRRYRNALRELAK